MVAATKAGEWPLIEAGKVRPIVHATLPLSQAAEAHRMVEQGGVVGKILLVLGFDLIGADGPGWTHEPATQ